MENSRIHRHEWISWMRKIDRKTQERHYGSNNLKRSKRFQQRKAALRIRLPGRVNARQFVDDSFAHEPGRNTRSQAPCHRVARTAEGRMNVEHWLAVVSRS